MRNWMKTNVPRRLLSLAVCAAMVFSLLPVSAIAEEAVLQEKEPALETSAPEETVA